jgi:hypothetical protein
MTLGEERAPDAIEAIWAYRMWIADGDGRLSSLNGMLWPATWLTAQCSLLPYPTTAEKRIPHLPPQEGCTCGVYAAKELRGILEMAAPSLAACADSVTGTASVEPGRGDTLIRVPMVGRVELAGKVIEHDFGYRAERARIAEIIPLPGFDAWTDVVARRYGLPVGEQLDAYALWSNIAELIRARKAVGKVSHPHQLDDPGPWESLWCLLGSLLFFVAAVHGILMDGGPHWGGWWLWPIAVVSPLVARGSFRIVRRRRRHLWTSICRQLGQFRFDVPGAPAESMNGRLPIIPNRPRPY